MRVIDPGHKYELDSLDGYQLNRLVFVKRVGAKYPGNSPPEHAGTTMQEVLRALVHRANYVNDQMPCAETESAIGLMKAALYLFEVRAARRHGRGLDMPLADVVAGKGKCSRCGHVGCEGR